MMFVFSSVVMMNANTIINSDSYSSYEDFNEPPDCFDLAAAYEAQMGGGYHYFQQAYDLCCGC